MPKTAGAALGLILALGFGGEVLAQRPSPVIVAPATQRSVPQRPSPPPVIRLPIASGNRAASLLSAPRPPSTGAPSNTVRAQRAPSAAAVRAAIPPAQLLTFQLAPTPWVMASALVGDMGDWTPLTQGAPLGGASVLRLRDGSGRVVVRGADSYLYVAAIDLAEPGGPIAASAWVKTGAVAQSEPHCQPFLIPDSLGDMLCGYLGPGGSARLSFMNLAEGYGEMVDLGGQNAGFRPTVLANPNWHLAAPFPRLGSTGGLYRKYELIVWDGSVSAFRLYRETIQPPIPGGPSDGPFTPAVTATEVSGDWTKMDAFYPTPMACLSIFPACAIGTTPGNIRLVYAGLTDDLSDAPVQTFFTPAVPGGLSLNVAPAYLDTASGGLVIVVRSNDGRIRQSILSANAAGTALIAGPWIDEGGFTRSGSGISCVASNEQPTCFVQGADGRIYWKKLGTASGL